MIRLMLMESDDHTQTGRHPCPEIGARSQNLILAVVFEEILFDSNDEFPWPPLIGLSSVLTSLGSLGDTLGIIQVVRNSASLNQTLLPPSDGFQSRHCENQNSNFAL